MQIAILGPLEVRDDRGVRDVAGSRLRSVLIRLALDAGRPVSATSLIDAVWDEQPPADEANALQSLVSRLRRAVGDPALIVAAPSGYRLDVAPDDVDAHRFQRLAADGGTALRGGDPAHASRLLRDALELWRGPALADVDGAPFATAPATRLHDLRLAAVVDRIEADLALGGGAQVVAELDALLNEHPLHERLAGQLVTALASAGRQADALAAYERIRSRLADELGVDPSPQLQAVQLAVLRGEASAPAPRPAVRRTNLRAQLTSFVGRDQEVARIGKLLEQNRLVTLAGPGGAGKTRLATEAASGLVEQVRGGIWFVGLASVTDGADVPHTVLGSLGLREITVVERPAKLTPQDAMTRLFDSLRDEDAVIVLDNCEHVIDATARLADQLLASCPELRILATSREPLGITGESLVVVPPLGLPAGDATTAGEALEFSAVRLFADRAEAVDADFTVDARTVPSVLEIVRRLDGLPLAIELAAARLRSMPVGEVARRLSDRFRLLTGGSRTALPRHRTLRAVVDWSWELLTPAERLLAERLAVFPAGATVASAEAVCAGGGIEVDDILDLLTSLVDKSLLVHAVGADGSSEARYRMLETIREYGTERLGERGELADVRGAHADHFAAFVAEADRWLRRSEQLEWITRLEIERDNALAALRLLIDDCRAQAALDMVTALSWYWMLIGTNTEVVVWTDAVLAVHGEVDPGQRVIAEAMRVMNSGGAFIAPGEDVTGWQQAVEDVAARLGRVDARRHPVALFLRGVLSLFTQDDERASVLIDEATRSEDAWVAAAALMVRANIAENVGDIAGMRTDAQTALAAFRRMGERWGQANSLQVLAMVATMESRLDDALELYAQALHLIHEMNSHEDEGFLLLRMADLRMRKGDLDGARRDLDRAADERTSFGFPLQDIFLLSMLADVARQTGDLPEARRLRDEAVARLAHVTPVHPMHGHGLALTVGIVARLDLLDGDLDSARRNLADAHVAAVGTRDQPIMAMVGVVTADLAAHLDRFPDAAEILGAAARLRGGRDETNLEVRRLTSALRALLGDAGFDEAYARGQSSDVDAAIARIDPSRLFPK